MELIEERLKPYVASRTLFGTMGPTGLQSPPSTTTLTVNIDIQESGGPRFEGGTLVRNTGAYVGFSYDALAIHDRLLATPYGALVVVSAYLWDDEEGEPNHYEIGLDPA
ncbi:MAG: hypothetical protein H0U69_03705 [Trueperaceae bacterium]|nr:hypothetical protein [Trueperaceae bacterium]